MNEDLAKEIGKNLFEFRLRTGISQAELAKKLNTEQPVISRAESGRYLPSMTLLKRIADVYNVRLIPPRLENEKQKT